MKSGAVTTQVSQALPVTEGAGESVQAAGDGLRGGAAGTWHRYLARDGDGFKVGMHERLHGRPSCLEPVRIERLDEVDWPGEEPTHDLDVLLRHRPRSISRRRG